MYVLQKMITWQFSHIMQTVLVAMWIVADCMTSSWAWVKLSCSPCKHENEVLSRCFKCPPCACRIPSKSKRCKPVGAVLTDVDGMAFHRLAEFFAPAVANWISRVVGVAAISVIFAGAIAMWPSLIMWSLWSLERLTSHSVQANSCCSKSQKHTVRTQKRSHMLEEMESERPLVWSCLLIDMNGNILYWEAENVSLVQVKSGDGLLLLPTCEKANIWHQS